jgi:hypothetical protein
LAEVWDFGVITPRAVQISDERGFVRQNFCHEPFVERIHSTNRISELCSVAQGE